MRSRVNDFENVVTVLTKVSGQNEGSWGFEHIRKAFDKDVKPFVKTLKEYFHMFDQGLHKEIIVMKEVFTQMETEVAKCSVERKTFEIKEKELLLENDSMEKSFLDEYSECVKLKAELSKKNDKVEKAVYDELSKRCARIKNRCISLEIKVQQYKESYQNNQPQNKQDAPEFPEFFEINELKARLKAKDKTINKLRDHIATVKGKSVSEGDKSVNNSKVIAPGISEFRDMCPLTRITSTTVVPPKKPISTTTVKKIQQSSNNSGKLKDITNIGLSSKSKSVESKISNNSKPNKNWGSNVSTTPSSSRVHFRFGNDHVATIKGYRDYQIGNVMISRVYYVKGLGHNLFLVGQFCDSDLEVAFRKHTCFVHDLEGVDLLKGSKGSNLYTLSLEEMMQSFPICLLSKASKAKSWLWHRSINGKKYILVIVDDYSRLTWVKFLRSKDETPEFTLKAYYEDVQISHQTSVARTLQQNGVVKRRNGTLVEVARTMLIFSKAPLFLWAEAVATACYTQKCSLIRRRHNKKPYELIHDKKPDLMYFHVFGALCYPTNDAEDLSMLKPKADIGIFVGYAPAKKAYRIYNRRTRMLMETIHVEFDELTTMAFEQFCSGPELQLMTPGIISSGLVHNPPSTKPYVSPTKNDWDLLLQPMFDEYFNPPPSVVSQVPFVAAPRPADLTGSYLSTSIDQDAPSNSTPSTT
ncbi:retrovirus-related pol polyprotein from transposon TNT 1-94 [Tanacetum coccineum]|uniref:Retrovirus-related pol polyprotein from transposon TNT 1-94 n=1 Tax=Tanacetum coccineum TaxID=301880 RepID=A0ABQ4WTY1_9ASTR